MSLFPLRTIAFLYIAVGSAISGCAQSKDVSQIENASINCETAEQDLQVLADAKADANYQLARGVSAITPLGAVLGLISGTEQEKLDMLSGNYIEKIEQKTAEIKAACGL